jgi:hypothetical protein
MTPLLSAAQRSRYARDGIVFPVPVLSAGEVRKYRLACDELEARLGGKPRTVEVRQMHLHFPWAYELATHPRVLDAVEDLLGPNFLLWATELFTKHARDAAVSIGWHRDRTYMGFDPRTTTTAWIALGPSTAANGCMRAVPGPARRQAVQQPQAGRRGASVVEEGNAVDVVLAPGEMSLHDADILHGSGPNCSEEKRVGFALRYITPAARPPHGRPPVVLARGHGVLDAFRVVGPPTEPDPGRALARMRESAALHLDAVLQNLRESGVRSQH